LVTVRQDVTVPRYPSHFLWYAMASNHVFDVCIFLRGGSQVEVIQTRQLDAIRGDLPSPQPLAGRGILTFASVPDLSYGLRGKQ
jgi:hypothetical protein